MKLQNLIRANAATFTNITGKGSSEVRGDTTLCFAYVVW